jgi:hypothetical protein
MKTNHLEIAFKVWALGLGVIAITAITFGFYKLAVGEYCSTASFTF